MGRKTPKPKTYPGARESREIVLAIRRGKVDALVTVGDSGDRVLMLQDSDHPYRVLVEKVNDGAATLDTAGTILYANVRFLEILNIPDKNFIGTSLQSHLSAPDRKTFENLISRATASSIQGDISFGAGVERSRLVRLAFHPMKSSGRKNICVIATELTELLKANEALKSNEESLRLLSARLLNLQDEERRHIARDLHDITGQKLAVQSMMLAQVMQGDAGLDAKSRRTLAESVSLNKQVGEEIRTLSYLLHPPLLDELGLSSAVKWFAEGFVHKTGIQLDVEIASDLQRLPPNAEVTLFRVIQESLTNVHRYSGSSNGFVRVTAARGEIEVQVGDFGKGMDRDKLQRAAGRGAPLGVGIQGMKERMRQLGGQLEIVSEIGKGTRVTARLPLSNLLGANPAEAPANGAEPSPNSQAEPVSPEAVVRKTILIVDDHEMLRRGIRTMLQQELDLEVCGEAVNGQEAIDKAKALHPDLVILDINLPVLNGLAAIRQILLSHPQTKILVFTVHDSEQTAKEIRAAGAHGYVSKGKAGEDLVRVMKGLLANQSYATASPKI